MTAAEFLNYLHELDIQIYLEGERLRCNAPEGIITPQLSTQIAKYKPELVNILSSQVKKSQIVPVGRDRYLPLSFAQQRLWFLEQLVPNNPFYNVPAAISLQGNLDYLALQRAFDAIVQRHEALRTNFLKVNGQPTQIIAANVKVPLPIVDLQHLPATERQLAAAQIATEEARRSFNLATDLLLRVKLLQLSETQYVLLLNLHHIASDGWSLGVLMRELAALYTNTALPNLPIQYADFACWQREYLQGEILETQLTYWKTQLAELTTLNLPTDRDRPTVQTYNGATHNLKLSPTLTAALESLSQQAGVTLFMTLLAAFQTLLHRYTGQDDIAVGSPIANRNRSELESLIGFFVNSLVLRVNLGDNPTFRELLAQVKEVTLAAYEHQDIPFEKLVEELHPERDLSRNPLFQVVFALQNAPMQPLELSGLTLQPLKFDVATTRFDLELHLWESGYGLSSLWEEQIEGISGFIAYNTDLFDAEAIALFTNHFQNILAAIVANPDTHIADLPLLSAAESHQLINEWNQTKCDYPDKLFHQLFAAQAEKTPDAIAVVCGDKQITYQELDKRSNQLARYLQTLGVAPETLVGICIERSIEMIVGILGIFKAGGAYVPLDPDYPSNRLQFILADTQIAIVVTQDSLAKLFSVKTICLDTDWDAIAKYSPETANSTVTADNLAYVIYTSGSTGKPKGVLLEHRGLCNVVAAQVQVFNLQAHNRVLQFSSLNFDASIFEMFLAFGCGASLYIPPPTARLPGADFVAFLQDNAIDTAILSPAVLSVLPAAKLPALQTVISGGEACSEEIVNQWAKNRSFFNAYGPTEVTIWATVAKLDVEQKPYIGRPVANTQVYLLDDRLQIVPVGVVGEIYIGSDGLARGYLNSADLTQERFITNPFVETQHLYKTGDRARYLPDGNLEFIGRIDEQIKIRGYRIELGEIETLLNRHPLVKSAIAIAHKERIIAYIIPQNEPSQLQIEQIWQWQNLYNQTYSQPAVNSDRTFNIIGWNSSYTKQPIPATEMQQWVNNRVSQILSLQPKRVLEIGCGTGLLLFQIAPHCTQYIGTDFSSASIQYIEQQLAMQPLPQVELQQRMANDFTDIAANSFDAAILNSVVQYFPSVDYLLQVLEQAINTVAPGGFIFIGDVRNLHLLPAFYAAVQLHQADDNISREQLHKQVMTAMFQETELAIAPAFFQVLQQRFAQISHIQIQPTRGRSRNELTQFRYNVILHIHPSSCRDVALLRLPLPPEDSNCQLNWTQDNLNFAAVRQYLSKNQPNILCITAIPNDRVLAAVTTAKWLTDETAPKNARQMRDTLSQLEQSGIEPEDWYSLEAELPYSVDLSWLNTDSTGCYDVILQHNALHQNNYCLDKQIPINPWETYANKPLQAQFTRTLTPQLQNYLEQNLPKYMIPSALVILEQFPLTANGKINRRALPTPELIQLDSKPDTAPRSPIEQKLAHIWTDLLGIKHIGIHDNFFHLGGHSLLATQLTSRIRDTFGVELPLQSIFETPQIAQIASAIADLQSRQMQQTPGIVRLSRDAHRRQRSSFDNTGR
ncbi:non-ribosomal peptide synthetase [Aliterella atlantica]|uniref:non-ribosomal peptide synthetase n=1 Tax=Aliterella atlantica TaxID=1827278 RepID=UPI00069683B5|nr:non-ribosomal peptide synthetase [Aliterella atlantica]